MPRFIGSLTMTQLEGEQTWRRWTLVHPLVYERGEYESGRLITCPEGFITDGPTIPRIFWAVLPVWGSWGKAGVVHDWLCFCIASGKPNPEAKTRTEADAIFYEVMTVLGVSFITRWLLYIGVRIGTIFNVRTTMGDYNVDLLGGA